MRYKLGQATPSYTYRMPPGYVMARTAPPWFPMSLAEVRNQATGRLVCRLGGPSNDQMRIWDIAQDEDPDDPQGDDTVLDLLQGHGLCMAWSEWKCLLERIN